MPLALPLAETLLLDLSQLVALQNELQRLCLVASSLLIVQQVGGWLAAGQMGVGFFYQGET